MGLEPRTSPEPKGVDWTEGLRHAPLLRPRALLAHFGARSALHPSPILHIRNWS